MLSKFRKWLKSKKRKRKTKLSDEPESNSVPSMSTGSKFGRMMTVHVKDCGNIPLVLTNAAAVVERNIKTKNMFQIQGVSSRVQSSLNQLSPTKFGRMKSASVHDVIEAMKTFLVRLPDPLLPDDLCDALINATQKRSVAMYAQALGQFHKEAPDRFGITHFMMRLLKKVSQHSAENGMDVRKLATIFVLDIIKPLNLEEINDSMILAERMQRLPYLIMVIETLISKDFLFKLVSDPEKYASLCDDFSSPGSELKIMESLTKIEKCAGDNISVNVVKEDECNSNKTQNKFCRSQSEPPKASRENDNANTVHEKRSHTSLSTTSIPITGVVLPGKHQTEHATAATTEENMRINNFKGNTSVEKVETEPPTRQGTSKDMKLRKGSPAVGVTMTKAKKFGSKTFSSFKKSPKRKRAASKGKSENRPNLRNKSPKSADKKSVMSYNKGDDSSPERGRKKTRTRTGKCKTGQIRSVSCCTSRASQFSAFQPDEEMAPWDEVTSNSDDTSVMMKTIKNPRVLCIHPSRPDALRAMKKRARENMERNTQSYVLIRPGFHMINQHAQTAAKYYEDDVSSLSDKRPGGHANQQPGTDDPPQPLPKDQHKSVISKYSSHKLEAVQEQSQDDSQKENKVKNWTEISKPAANNDTQRYKNEAAGNAEGGDALAAGKKSFTDSSVQHKNIIPPSPDTLKPAIEKSRVQTCQPYKPILRLRNTIHTPAPPEKLQSVKTPSPSQRVRVRVRTESRSLVQWYRQRVLDQLLTQELATRNPTNFVGEWLVDVFLVCLTLTCTVIVFYIQQYGTYHDRQMG